MPNDHPGIHLPPPLAYIAAVGGGWGLSRAWPWHFGGGIVRVIASYAILASGLALIVSSFVNFRLHKTSPLPIRPATTLVVAGPYRLTRNPMYVGMALLTIAVALWLDSIWILVLLVPALLVIDRYVIAREEGYLQRRFGPAYEAYCRRVRRWL